ncbi:hypothetical protein C0585_00910 [Candidatus Woesearchaeota archaeon]|uniref:hypothetical protein n=1 Tax=uncultured Arcobacter sp. TaxID=165434 RepID=UPI000CB125AA|nr:hypothetical protein [uncultured Arcobacter sp.]PLW80743.1 MAG: hypothetical protein C0585_00910 [Candidatus Woesearchaeota archaeon]
MERLDFTGFTGFTGILTHIHTWETKWGMLLNLLNLLRNTPTCSVYRTTHTPEGFNQPFFLLEIHSLESHGRSKTQTKPMESLHTTSFYSSAHGINSLAVKPNKVPYSVKSPLNNLYFHCDVSVGSLVEEPETLRDRDNCQRTIKQNINKTKTFINFNTL